MIDADTLSLIGSIYEAIGEEDAIPHVMSLLSGHLGAGLAFWYVLRRGAATGATKSPYLFEGGSGISDRTMREFREEMWRHDYALSATSVTNRTTETHELISDAELARNDFAQWLKTSAGVERRIGRSTDFGDGVVAGWAFHMPVGRARSESERARFDILAPHIRNLFKLTAQFGDAETRRAALEQVIDAQQQAVILLGSDGTICWTSEAAVRLCARNDGISLGTGRLTFARPAEKQAFDTLLQRAAAPDAATTSAIFGSLAIARPSGALPYILELSPAPAAFRAQIYGRAMFLLTVYDAEAAVDPRPERWVRMLGLTRMEAQVAMLSMRGQPDAAIAAHLGIGIGTVRTHQKQLLAKTGTRSKAEVAHFLTRLS